MKSMILVLAMGVLAVSASLARADGGLEDADFNCDKGDTRLAVDLKEGQLWQIGLNDDGSIEEVKKLHVTDYRRARCFGCGSLTAKASARGTTSIRVDIHTDLSAGRTGAIRTTANVFTISKTGAVRQTWENVVCHRNEPN